MRKQFHFSGLISYEFNKQKNLKPKRKDKQVSCRKKKKILKEKRRVMVQVKSKLSKKLFIQPLSARSFLKWSTPHH